MPRANRYFLPGKFYHLTHRCHDRHFLFKFVRDRNGYRQMVWESLSEFPVRLFSYCLTSNHAHWLVRAEQPETVSYWMQQLEGRFAQYYNRRKSRTGAFWEGRYHCTMIDGGSHLWNCMAYIELNMVRAGVVKHPSEWRWCSYPEWMGQRQRYRLVDLERCLEQIGGVGLEEFQRNYRQLIEEQIAKGELVRRPCWTESIAIGSEEFVHQIAQATEHRRRLEERQLSSEAWMLCEEGVPAG